MSQSTFRRFAALLLAILGAATATAVYRVRALPPFEPIRLAVLKSPLRSSRHVVAIPLPDLSELGGQPGVLRMELQNVLLQRRQVAVLDDGFPNGAVLLAPYRTTRWNLPLAPGLVRAFESKEEGARTLELTGDADGWVVTSLEIANYYLLLGNGPLLIVAPREAAAYPPETEWLPVAFALCVFAAIAALAPPPGRRWLRLSANGLALAVCAACAACLLLPALSPYRVLLSRSAFFTIAAAVFVSGLLHTASAITKSQSLVATLLDSIDAASRRCTRVAGFWRRHRVTCERGAALLGLTALSVAQPIFEVVSNSPEFFAARGTRPSTAMALVLVLGAGIPAALLGVERVVRAVSWRAAALLHSIVLAVMTTALVLLALRMAPIVAWPWDVAAGVLSGTTVAVGYTRVRVIRQFLTALAPAALVVPVLFLLDRDVRQNFLPSESAAAVASVARTPPIVFVVFDELPLNSLLADDGIIDAERYPNFAALARGAYWFRNASTVASNTQHAVPAILSGRYPTAANSSPTLQYFPVNVFTALAGHYEISAALRFQGLCPPRACHESAAQTSDTLGSLLSDLGLVWLHVVLPARLAEPLPPVTEDWADFGVVREAPAEDAGNGRAGAFARFLSSIDGRSGRLHFIHAMLPHMMFEYVPSGRRYARPPYETYLGQRLFERDSAAYADNLHQRHLAQVGLVDRLVGNLVARLHETGIFDNALVIVTSDHGASYREGRSRRQPQEGRNLAEILGVPLFIKLPGQQKGEAIDRIVETVDILPTILDVVGASATARLDGRSLVDPRVSARSSRTFIWRNRTNVAVRTIGDLSAQRAESLDRKIRRFGRGDTGALFAPPEARWLLGASATSLGLRSAPDVQVEIRNPRQFARVSLSRDPLPLYVGGILKTARTAPLTVAVVVNGRVAAVTQSYEQRRAHLFGTLIPEASLQDGDNSVTSLVMDGQTLPQK